MTHTARLLIVCLLLTASGLIAQTDSILHDGIQRNYILYTPSAADGTEELPLVINMHGRGSNAFQQSAYGVMNPVADLNDFIVVYPDALSYAGTTQWNVFSGSADLGTDDRGFLLALIDSLDADLAIDRDRIYTCGMSMGGYMSYRMICEFGDVFAAMASVTGVPLFSVLDSCAAGGRKVPVLQMHGTGDLVVPYAGVPGGQPGVDSTMTFFAQRNGCDATPTTTNLPDTDPSDGLTAEKSVWTNCADDGELWLYRVDGGGHTWPGSPITALGPTCQDFDGSTEIWEFFRQYTKNGRVVTDLRRPRVHMVDLHPNPTRGPVVLPEPMRGADLRVIDRLGREVLTLPAADRTADLGTLAPGWYLIRSQTHAAQVVRR